MSESKKEKAKYQKMWGVSEYRRYSPGEAGVSLFTGFFPLEDNETLIDFGCGTGRAARKLAGVGLQVTMVDITKDALDFNPELDFPRIGFVEASLWELPDTLKPAEWVFSTDVLEHIPPGKVDASLDAIASRTLKGGHMTVSVVKDGFGDMIGETLHLTVQPFEWWKDKIEARWEVLEALEHGNSVSFFVGKPHA